MWLQRFHAVNETKFFVKHSIKISHFDSNCRRRRGRRTIHTHVFNQRDFSFVESNCHKIYLELCNQHIRSTSWEKG